ncbi:MAG: type IV pilus modification PilV family protein [Nitrospinales bacterium]
MLRMQTHKEKMQPDIKGFTLIEVLIGMVIFSIGILAVAALQVSSTNGNSSARRITEATALAESQIEALMLLSYDHADLNPANNPHVDIQHPYTINWNVTEIDLDTNGTNDSKAVNVTVSRGAVGDREVSIQYIIPEY